MATTVKIDPITRIEGHLAFQVEVVANKGRLAVFANRHDGRGGLKMNRSPARRTIQIGHLTDLTRRPNFLLPARPKGIRTSTFAGAKPFQQFVPPGE